MSQPHIRVAIIGGGLAGATLANALIKVPHLDLDLYESSPELSERGAAVGLTSNAQRALDQILPSMRQSLNKAGAVLMNSSRIVLGSGPDAGTLVFDLAGAGDPGVVVHRASLMREIIAPLPEEIIHTSHELSEIRTEGDELEIIFQNGSVKRFDAIIGADGIFSKVRNYVVGNFSEHQASPAGFWDCRLLIPFEKARSVIGDQFFELDRQYGWIGDNAFIMHDVLDNRTMVQVVVSAIEKDPPNDRKRPLTKELLIETSSNWLEGPIAKGVIDLLLEPGDLKAYSQWEQKSTPTYSKGNVCLLGDAAHATTPWQGSGAGLAIEDAMILGHLLSHIKTRDELNAAFKAYDAVRRPRGQQVIDSSRGTGQIFCGQNQEIGLDPDKLRELLPGRWGFIMSLDVHQHKQDALEAMQAILKTDVE
ncbi:salicylate hydroxylase [Daldinia vernicosa]|uniref:salicylate hydroxylase n=1 Tax=Daldinia vernicosa TaxID=114800 RepID=UPI00200860A4|nr:salicylate hydroxylase [Daldinia vernicosa]KAI0845878.1 salicylate hydroxylase [Daldinia vernicosa]